MLQSAIKKTTRQSGPYEIYLLTLYHEMERSIHEYSNHS